MGFNSGFKGLIYARRKPVLIIYFVVPSEWFYSCKVKVKFTLVQALRLCTGRTAHRGSRGIALLFHDHGTRREWGVSVTPRPLFTPGKTRYPLYRRLGGPQDQSGQVWKSRPPSGFNPQTIQPVASRYTNWPTWTFIQVLISYLTIPSLAQTTYIPQSLLRQAHCPFKSDFSTQCDLVLPLSIWCILSFSQDHQVAAYLFFLVFPSLIPSIFPLEDSSYSIFSNHIMSRTLKWWWIIVSGSVTNVAFRNLQGQP
jgi:hypothetical protein